MSRARGSTVHVELGETVAVVYAMRDWHREELERFLETGRE